MRFPLKFVVFCVTFVLGLGAERAFARPGEYGKLRKEFKDLCELLKEDGRMILVAKLLEPNLPKNKECPDCRPLFMQFFGPCEPPPPPKLKPTPTPLPEGQQPELSEAEISTPTPTSTPIAPQRFPQLAVLDVASEISIQLAADERNPAQTAQAVEALAKVLTPTSLLPGERDYLETLASFLKSGFESDLYGPTIIKPKPSTKGLFDEGDESANEADTVSDEESGSISSTGFR